MNLKQSACVFLITSMLFNNANISFGQELNTIINSNDEITSDSAIEISNDETYINNNSTIQESIKKENTLDFTFFALSEDDDAINIVADNACINGDIGTSGNIWFSKKYSINGNITESIKNYSLPGLDKIKEVYFNSAFTEYNTDNFKMSDDNVNLTQNVLSSETINLNGNISLDSSMIANSDILITGNNVNANNTMLCSETSDIKILTKNFSMTGLLFAPNGTVEINADIVNLNSIVIIAQKIIINCSNLNANYNIDISNKIGDYSDKDYNNTTEDSNIDTTDVKIFSFGEYDKKNNLMKINWTSNYTGKNYEILYSEDNQNYSSIAKVTNVKDYEFELLPNFEIMYFKVKTLNLGQDTVESIPFYVLNENEEYYSYLLDSDGDGLYDMMEDLYDTDITCADTDNDGLTDYQEICITETDPLKYDSVLDGISDSLADNDGDGLSNIDEINYGTKPNVADTDCDGLIDYDEISKFSTNPLSIDSDNDFISDNDELIIKLDPNNPTTYDIDDSKYVINQNIKANSESLSEINTDKNAYNLSIEVVAAGYAENSVDVCISPYANALSNDTILGDIINVSYDSRYTTNSYILNFEIKDKYIDNVSNKYTPYTNVLDGIKRLQVFRYNDEHNMLLPVETEYDIDSHSVICKTEKEGTYCLVDMELWLDNIGYEVEENTDSDISLFSDESVNTMLNLSETLTNSNIMLLKTASYVSSFATNNTNSDDISSDMEMKYLNGHKYGIYSGNLVLSWTEAESICEDMGGHLVSVNSQEENDFIHNLALNHSPSKNLYWIGGTKHNGYWEWCDSSEFNYTNWASGEPNCLGDSEFYVHMYTDTGLWNDTLNSYNANNYYATKNCGFICEWDNQTIKSYYAIIGDNFKHLVLRSPLKRNGKTDTDSDTLTDWEEFDSENEFLDWTSTGEPIFPTYGKLQDKISFVPHELMVELNGLDNYLDTVYVAPFKSNPMVGGEDTDGDGLYDGVARYVGLRKAVPKDPEPKYYNGPTGLWEKQYQSVGSSRLTCNYNYEQIGEYSNSRLNMVSTIDDLKIYAPNLYNALSKAGEKLSEFINAKNMVDLALSKGSIIKDEKVKDTLKQISQYIKPYATYTEFGAYILNFVYDSKNIAYHSQVDTWQRKFGYADLYDEVFDIGSKMNYLRESFSNGYMLWLWKGDYWNLYSGAEIGLYRYNRRVGSYDYYDAIDYELPMTINLYNYNNNDWENVFSWHPYIEQWWITGFNPNFKTPDSDKMYVIGTISFKDDEKLFNDFANGHRKIKYNNIFENYIYDREDNTIWIMWH